MGDLAIEEEKILLDTYNLDNVDILKVSHHGSKYGIGDDLMKEIHSSYALI